MKKKDIDGKVYEGSVSWYDSNYFAYGVSVAILIIGYVAGYFIHIK